MDDAKRFEAAASDQILVGWEEIASVTKSPSEEAVWRLRHKGLPMTTLGRLPSTTVGLITEWVRQRALGRAA